MPWRTFRNQFTPRQREFLERLFDLAKEYEKDNVFASGNGVIDPYTYQVIALVYFHAPLYSEPPPEEK